MAQRKDLHTLSVAALASMVISGSLELDEIPVDRIDRLFPNRSEPLREAVAQKVAELKAAQ